MLSQKKNFFIIIYCKFHIIRIIFYQDTYLFVISKLCENVPAESQKFAGVSFLLHFLTH